MSGAEKEWQIRSQTNIPDDWEDEVDDNDGDDKECDASAVDDNGGDDNDDEECDVSGENAESLPSEDEPVYSSSDDSRSDSTPSSEDSEDSNESAPSNKTEDTLCWLLSSLTLLPENGAKMIGRHVTKVDKICSHFVPSVVNLMNDFVESELFVIDGDSLVLEILSTPSLDFQHGGQYLHLVYLVEQFLQYFTERGGLFHVVFFKCMESIWLSTPSKLLARNLIIFHLQENTKFQVFTGYGSWYSEGWHKHLNDNHPAFMVVADGDTQGCFHESDSLPNYWTDLARFLYQSLAVHTLCQRVNIAYPSNITHTVTKLFGYYIECHSRYGNRHDLLKLLQPIGKTAIAVANVMKKHRREASFEPQHDWDQIRDIMMAFPEDLRQHKIYNIRTVLTMMACSDALQEISKRHRSSENTDTVRETSVKICRLGDLPYAYFVHTLLLGCVPLETRAQYLSRDSVEQLDLAYRVPQFLKTVHRSLCTSLLIVQRTPESDLETVLPNDGYASVVTDIMDGRLFYRLLEQLHETNSLTEVHRRGIQMPDEIANICSRLWSLVVSRVEGLCDHLPPQLDTSPAQVISPLGKSTDDRQEANTEGLIPVQCDLVTNYAGDVLDAVPLAKISEDGIRKFLVEGQDFDERYHWHSGREFADEYESAKDGSLIVKLPEDKRDRKWQLKNKQFMARHMQRLGQSLQGKMFGGVQQETILLEKKRGKNTSKPKTSEGSKAKEIRDQKRMRDEEINRQRAEEKWIRIQHGFKGRLLVGDFKTALRETDAFISGCTSEAVALDAQLKKVDFCWKVWKQQRSNAKSEYAEDGVVRHEMNIEGALLYPVQMFATINGIIDKFGGGNDSSLTDRQKIELATHMHKLGFSDMAKRILNHSEDAGAGCSVKDSAKVLNSKTEQKYRIKMSSARFQLQYMGHLMKREVRHDPDPRVTTFIPDTWQRELLDAVDNNESAVIVAPTSSGKTYASFYCMRKILKEDNEGVLVYVAPTKALVNQVAAEVGARFSKSMPPGKALYGVFTRDLRKDTLNCQILVTVPQAFEILLLSPKRQAWAAKIKYVIFDEVHCLGGEIGAEVWEHLLVMIQCPFLALSATIRNPEDLQRWLQQAQHYKQEIAEKQQGQGRQKHFNSYKVNLVTYSERYSDLEKYVYLPNAPSKRSELHGELSSQSKTDTSEFKPLHPAATLSYKQFCENGFPGDMTFSPRETLQLYDLMVLVWSGAQPPELQQLEPGRYFQGPQATITRTLARQYEQDIKSELLRWRETSSGEKKIEKLLRRLRGKLVQEINAHEEGWETMRYSPKGIIGQNFYKLLMQLDAQDKLPALVFSFDRKFCEALSANVTEILEEREEKRKAEFYRTDEGKQAKKDTARYTKVAKRSRDKKEKKKEDDDTERGDGSSQLPITANQYESEIQSEYSLASKGSHTQQDLDRILHQVRHFPDNHPLKRSFKRGVAYHHAGLGNKWRMAVENLFRTKYLRVVIATGTLALGIHMPCKTVIFAGDSTYLNATQYRQMAGRSGRRGFDLVGNVIFFGIPKPKVNRLIMSSVPHLKGNFPVSVTLVLRLLLLTANSDDKRDACDKALSLLKHPFLCYDRPEMDSQVKHYFLFSVEYLIRKGLLDTHGIPQGLAGLATHLHYHEPSNYVLLSFLKYGAFHRLCRQRSGKFSEETMRTLVLVLANLFGRTTLQGKGKPSSSVVILEDLPRDFRRILNKHNQDVENTFRLYVRNITDQAVIRHKLPLSKIEFQSPANNDVDAGEDDDAAVPSDVVSALQKTCHNIKAASAFAALSGVTDENLNASDSDFMQRLREGVYMEDGNIPTLPHRPVDRRNRKMELNAYALDFFKHGSSTILITDNRLQGGEVFDKLKDFTLTIKSISVALTALGPEEDGVVKAFNQLACEYDDKFKEAFGFH